MRFSCNRARPSRDADRDHLFPQDRKPQRDLPLDVSENLMFFPMFLMAWDILMGLQRMEAHQTILARGHLTEFAASFTGKVVFISHEWLSLKHPDPDGVQLRTIQGFLKRVDQGLVVTPYYTDAVWAGLPEKTDGAHWKAIMPRCFFWLDFAGVPQVVCEAEAPMPHTASDHRSVASDDMIRAVRSIPAYIGASTLLIILTPRAEHQDIAGRVCDYASWARRGWCRVEMTCAMLARRRVRIIHCIGPEAPAVFMSGAKTSFSPPGLGEFTCCALGHEHSGKRVPCDKVSLGNTMADLLKTSASYAWADGDPDRMRFLLCRGDFWMQGFPSMLGDDAVRPFMYDLRSFRERLRWGEANEHSPRHGRTRASGKLWTLLHWAALTGRGDLVREVLCQEGAADLNRIARPMPDFHFMNTWTPLALAAVAIRSFDAIEVLIDARADPDIPQTCEAGLATITSPLVIAIACGTNAEQLNSWLQRFPHHINYPLMLNKSVFSSALRMLFTNFEDLDDRWRVLVSHGADLRERSPALGSEANLITACINLTPSVAALRAMLDARCDVNARLMPCSLPAKLLCYPSIAALKLAQWRCSGVSNSTTVWSMYCGATALHFAAHVGHVEVVRLLLEARARCRRNVVGDTPLECAARAFGGAPPQALVQLLAGGMSATVSVLD